MPYQILLLYTGKHLLSEKRSCIFFIEFMTLLVAMATAFLKFKNESIYLYLYFLLIKRAYRLIILYIKIRQIDLTQLVKV